MLLIAAALATGAETAGAGAFAAGASLAFGLEAVDFAAVSILATTAPISKSSPSAATYINFPSASAGNSKVALSDSNSQIGSSNLTKSPSSFNQDDSVTSVIDSPITGTFNSTILMI